MILVRFGQPDSQLSAIFGTGGRIRDLIIHVVDIGGEYLFAGTPNATTGEQTR